MNTKQAAMRADFVGSFLRPGSLGLVTRKGLRFSQISLIFV